MSFFPLKQLFKTVGKHEFSLKLDGIQQFDFKLNGESEILLTLAVYLWIIPWGRLFQVSKGAERYEKIKQVLWST